MSVYIRFYGIYLWFHVAYLLHLTCYSGVFLLSTRLCNRSIELGTSSANAGYNTSWGDVRCLVRTNYIHNIPL